MPRMTERWLPDTSVLLARARKEPVKDMGLEGNKCCPYTTTLRYGVEIYGDDMDIEINLKGISRIEVIDKARGYVKYFDEDRTIVIQVQDDGRTLKVFVLGE